MSGTAILPHETHGGRSNGRGKSTKERHDGLQRATAFDDKSKRGRVSTDSLCRETRVGASRIRRIEHHFDVAKAGLFSGAGDRLGQGKSLVANDSKGLQLHQSPSPGDRLRGNRRLEATAPLRKGRERRLSAPELGSSRRTGARDLDTSPEQKNRAQH